MNEINLTGAALNIAWWCVLYEILEYFSISCEALSILSILLILDFVMGIVDAYIKDRSQVTSAKMWKWLVKKVTRRMLPFIVVWIFRWAWIEDMSTIVSMIISMLIVTEWYSIIGHIYSINTWKEILEIDAFEMILNFLLKLLKGKLPDKEEDLEKKEEEEK